MQKYFQETQVLEQITEKRREQRKLADQLALSQAKEAKSKAYHQKKGGSCKMKKKAKAEKKKEKAGKYNFILAANKQYKYMHKSEVYQRERIRVTFRSRPVD